MLVQQLTSKHETGYIGTNGVRWKDNFIKTGNTTSGPDLLYKYMQIFYNDAIKNVSMETSSEAFFYGRLMNLKYDIAMVTNITSDHMNTHKTLDNYIRCKKMLIEATKDDGYVVLNKDDKHYEEMKAIVHSNLITFGQDESSNIVIKDISLTPTSSSFKILFRDLDNNPLLSKYNNQEVKVDSPLLAIFNIYNLTEAMIASLLLGYPLDDVVCNVIGIKADGRMEVLEHNGYHIIVDFAHTEGAIRNILTFANSVNHNKIYVITGAAGGKDHTKMPKIGKVLYELADFSILTMDNPRFEEVEDICNEIIGDQPRDKFKIIVDRDEAIRYALSIAQPGDLLLFLGKSNEGVQYIKGEKIPYDEWEHIKKNFI